MPFEFSLHVWKSRFSFLSPLPLDECATRLHQRNEPTRLFSFKNPLKVEVDPVDQDTFQYSMRRDSGRNLVVEIVGVLERNGEETLVSGESRFSRTTIVLTLLLSIFILPWFGLVSLVFGGFLLLIFSIVMISGCRALERELETTLESPGLADAFLPLPQHRYMQSKKNRNLEVISIIFVAGFILAIVSSINGVRNSGSAFCTIGEALPRQVLTATFGIKPIWSLQAGLGTGYDKPRLVIVGDKLYAQNCWDITAFDLMSGKVIWVSEHTNEFADGFEGQMTVDVARDRIYGRNNIWGIRAISMSTGKILWISGEQFFEHDMPYLDLLNDGRLLAESEKGAWYVDPQTGNLQPTTVITQYGNLPQRVNDIVLTLPYSCESCLRANNAETQQLLWRFVGDNGADLVSNAAVDHNVVYIMDQHAKIYLLDLQSGNRLGEIQFEFPQNQDELHNGDGQISDSVIAVQGNFMVVSFHDTNALVLYAISPR